MKKKILCLFPRFYSGGVSKALSFVANTCDEAGMEVHCISFSSQSETINLNPNIHRYTIDLREGATGVKKICCRIAFMIHLRHKIKKIDSDVIVVFRADLVKATVIDTIGIDVPIICSERGNPLIYGNLLNKYRKAFNRCSVAVFQTEAARDVYRVDCKNVIIPNPAVKRYSSILDRNIRTGKNFITVSRLSKEKNIEGLLRAFSLVKDILFDRKLILYGDGPQQEQLEQLINDLGIDENVFFAGNVNDFTEINDDASIFVLNSLSEGMPNALIEAMIAGYACICTDCPIGAPHWLSDNERRVKLVPVNNEKALAAAMVEVAMNDAKAKFLATNAREIVDILSPQKIGRLWLNLITEVIDEHKKKNQKNC